MRKVLVLIVLAILPGLAYCQTDNVRIAVYGFNNGFPVSDAEKQLKTVIENEIESKDSYTILRHADPDEVQRVAQQDNYGAEFDAYIHKAKELPVDGIIVGGIGQLTDSFLVYLHLFEVISGESVKEYVREYYDIKSIVEDGENIIAQFLSAGGEIAVEDIRNETETPVKTTIHNNPVFLNVKAGVAFTPWLFIDEVYGGGTGEWGPMINLSVSLPLSRSFYLGPDVAAMYIRDDYAEYHEVPHLNFYQENYLYVMTGMNFLFGSKFFKVPLDVLVGIDILKGNFIVGASIGVLLGSFPISFSLYTNFWYSYVMLSCGYSFRIGNIEKVERR